MSKDAYKDMGRLAFPHEYGSTAPGMTLRDYFAAKAMQSIARETADEVKAARWAYEMADAMLEAREQ
jgi:hypothetical protein